MRDLVALNIDLTEAGFVKSPEKSQGYLHSWRAPVNDPFGTEAELVVYVSEDGEQVEICEEFEADDPNGHGTYTESTSVTLTPLAWEALDAIRRFMRL